MQIFVEIVFYSKQRTYLPISGYRPDAVFNNLNDYWGIVFTDFTWKDLMNLQLPLCGFH